MRKESRQINMSKRIMEEKLILVEEEFVKLYYG
jgi:hypothetical protein